MNPPIGKPIALGIAKAYGYAMPQFAAVYSHNEIGQTCLDVTMRPISTIIVVRENHDQK